jgi:protein-S-isoprenylcysteine O-methyltransferase Ste14
MILGLFYNLFLVYQSKVFNEAKSQSNYVNAIKTLIQIICVWSITLILFPWIIIDAFELQDAASWLAKMSSYFVFIISSVIGLSSAFYLIRYGNGTPLPADQTKRLVINGPYRYVRNPMAIAGMGQGLAISLYFGSVHLVVYTLIGGLLWHFVVRPIEEKNMQERFGGDYENYRSSVNLWFPKLKS